MSNWSLRLLSNPYKDVALELDDGQHILGSDDDSDLVIASDSVLAQHICLHVDQDTVELAILDTSVPVYINGIAIDGDRCPLAARDVVTLGSFSLTLGTEDDDLATVSIPEIAHPVATTGLFDDESDGEWSGEHDDQPTQETAQLTHEQPASWWAKCWAKLPMKRQSMKIASVAASALVILSIIITPWLTANTNAKTTSTETVLNEEETLTPDALLAQLADDLELPKLRVNTKGGLEPWVIEGYVDHAQQQRQLRQWLGLNHPSIHDNVAVIGHLISGAHATLEALGYSNITISTDDHEWGALILQGEVQDGERWHATLKQLESDVHGVQWRDAVQVHRPYATPDIAIQSISLGRHPFFIGDNGKKYFVGSVYGAGYSVEEIELSHIVMRQGDNRFTYNLGINTQ